MSESSKRHSKFLSLIFILKCLSKASVITLFFYIRMLFFRPWGPFLESPGDFSGPKSNIQIEK